MDRTNAIVIWLEASFWLHGPESLLSFEHINPITMYVKYIFVIWKSINSMMRCWSFGLLSFKCIYKYIN